MYVCTCKSELLIGEMPDVTKVLCHKQHLCGILKTVAA